MTGILKIHVLEEVSTRVLPVLDWVLRSVYLASFHENILTLLVPDGLRVSLSVSGPLCLEDCREVIV